MDTESIIQQLVEAKSTKVKSAKKAQTKLEWKQEAWKDLNTKLKNLQSKFLSNMRFSNAYAKKTTKVSNSSAVSVITGENAVNGVQDLEIRQLAKTSYLTGGTVTKKEGASDGEEISALTKVSDLAGMEGFSGNGSIKVTVGKNEAVQIDITEETTISDVLTKFKEAGLNASFDAKWGRFSISAKESGKANDFEIEGVDESGKAALSAMGLEVDTAHQNDENYKGAYKTVGQDAVIYLNGARYENSTNVFDINGLTFTALSETKEGEKITVTTEQDVDGIYDVVKNFLKEYNSIINEMDKLYNAESAKGYEPLTDDEREAMSESEIEKYESKIKDSLLRRDDNLYTLSNALKSVMSAGVEVNGKSMHLFDFGIDTLSYLNAADNEKNAYHIDGDPDDTDTAGNADKLKSMIANDPDTVINFFTKLSQNLYSKMSDLSKSVDGYRSFGNFYDDKKMKSDYDSYTTKIKEQEQKLNDYEDKWYKKFAAMETAMAKMQSSASAITSLLGG